MTPASSTITLDQIRAGLQRPPPPPEEHDLHMISLREGTKVTEAAVLSGFSFVMERYREIISTMEINSAILD